MYLSFSNLKIIFKYLIISFFLILIQAYSPQVWVTPSLNVSIDLFLIFLTFLCLIKDDLHIIIFYAFLVGLFQDFIINVGIIGILSLLKSLSVYFIGLLNNRNRLWNKKIKTCYIYMIYFFHFIVYYYVLMNNDFVLIVSLSFIQSMVSLILFYLIEKLFFRSNLL